MPAVISIKITGVNDAKGALDEAAKGIKNVDDAARNGGGGFSAFKEVATGALRAVGAAAVSLAGDAAGALAGFVKDSVGVAGDFEAGMNTFQAAAGKAVDPAGLEKFKDLFISLGKELPVSTSEVQAAATEMVTGGIDPAIVAGGALRQTLQFAAASGMSLTEAAETSAKFLAGWTDAAASTAEKVDFLTQSTDTLTKAAAVSSTDVEHLRLGIFNTQGTAQALGVTFEDTAASLGYVAKAFESSAQAGTAMNVFLTRVVPSTNPAKDAMKELGIVTKDNQNLFFDSQGAFLGMANAAQVLKDHMSGLSAEQKVSYLHTMFGNDAMKFANELLKEGADGINTFKENMAAANGVQEQAALKQAGFNVALDNAKGSMEALQITIGSMLLPILTEFLNNTIAPGINLISMFAEAVFGSDEAFAQLSPQLQAVVNLIGSFQEAFESGGIIGLIHELSFQLFGTVAPAQQAMSILSTVAGVLQIVIPAAVAALLASWQSGFATVSAVVMTILPAVLVYVQSIMGVLLAFWQANGASIMAFWQTVWTQVSAILQTAAAIMAVIFQAIAGFISAHGTEIVAYLTTAWNLISGIITTALNLISGILKAVLQAMQGDWAGAWSTIQQTSARFVEGIIGVLQNGGALMFQAIDLAIAGIRDLWAALVRSAPGIGKSFIGAIADGINSAVGALVSAAKQAVESALNAAKSAIGAGGGGGGGSAGGSFPGRASGGPVVAGAPYLVGERGPELFVPSQSGGIVPAGQTRNITNNYTLNSYSNASASTVGQDFALMRTLAGA